MMVTAAAISHKPKQAKLQIDKKPVTQGIGWLYNLCLQMIFTRHRVRIIYPSLVQREPVCGVRHPWIARCKINIQFAGKKILRPLVVPRGLLLILNWRWFCFCQHLVNYLFFILPFNCVLCSSVLKVLPLVFPFGFSKSSFSPCLRVCVVDFAFPND